MGRKKTTSSERQMSKRKVTGQKENETNDREIRQKWKMQEKAAHTTHEQTLMQRKRQTKTPTDKGLVQAHVSMYVCHRKKGMCVYENLSMDTNGESGGKELSALLSNIRNKRSSPPFSTSYSAQKRAK